MKSNKQGAVSGRKPKVKKDGLSGWGQEDESLLQDEIGIDTWYEDRKQSGREMGYVCALVESYERQEKARLYKPRNTSSRRSQRHSATATAFKTSLGNQNKSGTKQNEIDHNTQSKSSLRILSNADIEGNDLSAEKDDHVVHGCSDPTEEINDLVIFNQSEHNNEVIAQAEGDWAKQFVFRHGKDSSDTMGSGGGGDCIGAEPSPPENLAMLNLIRYQEKLRKRRENRLKKSMEIISKTELLDTVSPCKKAANITSITYAEGMMQPINDTDNNTERTTHQNNSRTTLPSILKARRQNGAQNTHSEDGSSKSPKSGSDSSSKNSAKYNKNIHIKNGTKFNFDILEKYASIRNSKSKASFTDYVEKMRSLRHCGTEDDGSGFHSRPEDNILKEVLAKGGSQSLRGAIGDSVTFDHVRELWYESQRSRIVKRVNRRTRSLPSYSNGASKVMMVVDVQKRNRCMSQPVGGGDQDTKHYQSLIQGKYHSSKHKCPLQRMLSATNRRLEANKIHGSRKEQKIMQNTENETVELTRTENGIKCCAVGRSSPTNNQTSSVNSLNTYQHL